MPAVEHQNDAAALRRVARRVETIMQEARRRERRGQSMAIDIEARLRLQDRGAVQFQVATAILEEISGLREEEVVTELLSLGLAAVIESAAEVAEATAGVLDTEQPRLTGPDEGCPKPLHTGATVCAQSRILN